MPPDQLPDITAQPGEIVAQPVIAPPGFASAFCILTWSTRTLRWQLVAEHLFPTKYEAERFAARMSHHVTHYRIVRIPGDEKGAEHDS